MSIAAYVVRPDSLAASHDRVTLRVGLPWYRSLPWAGVVDVELEIDGIALSSDEVTVDGQALSDLSSRRDYWHIQHRATILFPTESAPPVGSHANVIVRVHLRIPGPLLADGRPMPFTFEDRRDIVVAAI